jgi:alpha-aminoadipic semialdehyde synthase
VKKNYNHPVITGAMITDKGELVERHKPLSKRIESVLFHQQNKRILVLGSGMVSQPLIDYLHRNEKYHITIGNRKMIHLISIKQLGRSKGGFKTETKNSY